MRIPERNAEQKMRSDLFIKKTLPLLAAGLLIGYGGLKAIHTIFEGARYEYLASYLWIAVFFIFFVYANQVLVVQRFRQTHGDIPNSRR